MIGNFARLFEGYANYLPAISRNYAEFALKDRFQREVPFVPGDLDFLCGSSNLFTYPWALYSAGQGAKTASVARHDNFVNRRDKSRSLVVADSGGFQISEGTIAWEGKSTQTRLLEWMERHANYCMALDFPISTDTNNNISSHIVRMIDDGADLQSKNARNRLGEGYNACLYQTFQNDMVFNRRAHKHTRILNVVQGRNETEAKWWFDVVKKFDFSGWAFAGHLCKNLAIPLRRIIELRDSKALERCELIHFLGIGELHIGCLYTTLKRCIEASINRRVYVTFDAASPFQASGRYGTVYVGFSISRGAWNINGKPLREINRFARDGETLLDVVQRSIDSPASNNRSPIEQDNFTPTRTKIATTMPFIGSQMAISPEGRPDTDGYMLLANHNVHTFATAHLMAQTIFNNRDNDARLIPSAFINASNIIENVFRSETPFDEINRNEKILDFA